MSQNPTLAELLAQQAELARRIAAAQSESREGAIKQILQIAGENGITLQDIQSALGVKPRVAAQAPGEKSSKPVAAKYRNPSTGETWTGRGLAPRWLREKLDQGASKEQFLIQSAS